MNTESLIDSYVNAENAETNETEGMGTHFEGEAKIVKESGERKNIVIQVLRENGKKPTEVDAEFMKQLNIAGSNVKPFLKALATLLFEFFGVKPWEMGDVQRLKDLGMEQRHIDICMDHGDVGAKVEKFQKTNSKNIHQQNVIKFGREKEIEIVEKVLEDLTDSLEVLKERIEEAKNTGKNKNQIEKWETELNETVPNAIKKYEDKLNSLKKK